MRGNVTQADMDNLVNAVCDVSATAQGLYDKLRKGECDILKNPLWSAREILSASRVFARLAQMLMGVHDTPDTQYFDDVEDNSDDDTCHR